MGIFFSLNTSLSLLHYALIALGLIVLLALIKQPLVRILLFLGIVSCLESFSFKRALDHFNETRANISREKTLYEGIIKDVLVRHDGRKKILAIVRDKKTPAHNFHIVIYVSDAAQSKIYKSSMPIMLYGVLRAVKKPLSPMHFNEYRYGLSHNIHGSMSIRDPEHIWVGDIKDGLLINHMRQRLKEIIFNALTPHQASLLLALIVGDTSLFEPDKEELYQKLGAQHLLAVSGLQVALIGFLVFFLALPLFSLLLTPAQTHMSYMLAASFTLILLVIFIALCDWPKSALRAGLMALILLIPPFFGRKQDSFDALFLSFFILLLLDPLSIFDLGFLLSYAAVFGLILAHHHSKKLRAKLMLRSLFLEKLVMLFVGSLSAFLATLPIVALSFGVFAPLSVVSNFILVPLASFLQIPAILGGILGALLKADWLIIIGAFFASCIEIIAEALEPFLSMLSVVPPISPWLVSALCLGLFVFLLGILEASFLIMILAIMLFLPACPSLLKLKKPDFSATIMAIGQGDATLFSLPSGEHFLIDAGGVPYGNFDPGISLILPSLKAKGIKKLEALIITHPDPDHILGAFAIIDAIAIKEIWHSGYKKDHPLTERLLRAAQKKHIVVKDAHDLLGCHNFGTTTIEVLAPRTFDSRPYFLNQSANDNSLVLRISHQGYAFLWPGDIEHEAEKRLIAQSNVKSSVLKAPHHGSKTSSTLEFIDAVDPTLVIFSTGVQNRFGHPHKEIVERYKQKNIKSLNTALDGEITITIKNGSLIAKSYCKNN